jgi:HAD superfamily hydrolase (TIGR01509 family)
MTGRRPIDAVVFDAGGTLGRIDFEWIAEMLGTLGVHVTAEALRAGELEGRRRYDASAHARARGDAGVERATQPGEPDPPLGVAGDIAAYYGGTLDAAGVPRSLHATAIARMQERQAGPGLWTRVMEGARGALEGLRDLGVRRAVVSNSDGRAAQHIADWGLADLLEFVVDSRIVGVEKPDPRIFRIALDRLGVPAERALYVGDIRSVDEAGSRAAGMAFVLIDPSGDYAALGEPRIGAIGELPSFVSRHFDLAPAPPVAAPQSTRGGSR